MNAHDDTFRVELPGYTIYQDGGSIAMYIKGSELLHHIQLGDFRDLVAGICHVGGIIEAQHRAERKGRK